LIGLGSIGYISTLSLQSTIVSTTTGLEKYISSFIDPTELASSVLQFISSTYFGNQLASTVTGLGTSGYISSTGGFISTPNLLNLVSTPNLINLISTSFFDRQLASTVAGLGSSRYVSSFFNISSISAQQLVVSSIGIGCNAPYYQLDIIGTGHANIFSSLVLQTSSYTGNLGDAQTLILWEI
jgi:hypothetical protein